MESKISYEPLFETMKEQGISTYKLFKSGINSATYYRIKEGKHVNLDTILRLCIIMDCKIEDIIEVVTDADR